MVPRRRRCCAAKVAPHGAWRDIAGPAAGPMDPDYDYMTFPEVVASAVDAYAQAGIKDPRQALGRRCSPAPSDLDGELAVNPDGALKSFGHPIGASGLRMLFEAWLQLRGEAGKRQIASVARGRKLALTHNLGGAPGECVSFVGIVGSEPSVASRVRPAVLSPASHRTRKATT